MNTSQSLHGFKRFLFASLVLNLVFMFFFGYTIYRRGGSAYLIKRTKAIFTKNMNSEPSVKLTSLPLNQSPIYRHKKSHFESLPDSDNEIIFLGDSITDWCQWSELFPNSNIKNRGIGGDRVDGILQRLPEVVSSLPDKIFLMVGVNDLSWGVDIQEIVRSYERVIQKISENTPGTTIYVQSVLPVNLKTLLN